MNRRLLLTAETAEISEIFFSFSRVYQCSASFGRWTLRVVFKVFSFSSAISNIYVVKYSSSMFSVFSVVKI